jgi:hypothetical protein
MRRPPFKFTKESMAHFIFGSMGNFNTLVNFDIATG